MKYLRRIVWFFANRLLVLCLILGLIMTVFYYTMNLSNIQIVLKDGMANRAKYIMGMENNRKELDKYFQAGCLENDNAVRAADEGNSPYENYNVRGIDHRLEMGFLWVWPWENSVRLTVKEKIPRIDGRVKGSKADEVIAKEGNEALYPPAWQDAEYRAYLIRENGQWKIKTLTSAR
ncbi:hypothetical protein [Aristaeella hokkaidonensis]|uniref:Uncharacterized protein n=1 Tax=Aristaeella hokkaidonensis TaxID=3046382 RepID=A0AC61N8T2_9FIRM|nr:hypothetical protein [Aristaeella hokkaidonensis]QUC68326.1 hypothetical protein JYE49_06455 [Aristaeella hokkaidonensis]SNT95016.1 hypothetical protein SAMN06297421_1092 [Aristaeella hokkaidonensis]